MATFNLDENQALYQIRAYRPGCISINDMRYTQSLIITPTQLITHWPVAHWSEICAAELACILPLKPDILLIGTGAAHELLSVAHYGELINHGIGVEVMSTSAACRTYSALSAENRNVVAALVID